MFCAVSASSAALERQAANPYEQKRLQFYFSIVSEAKIKIKYEMLNEREAKEPTDTCTMAEG